MGSFSSKRKHLYALRIPKGYTNYKNKKLQNKKEQNLLVQMWIRSEIINFKLCEKL